MMFWPDPDETGGTCSKPGIYRITIEDEGYYVGRYSRASRPLREYRRNVAKLLDGQPYRLANPTGFRYIHYALHRAVIDKRSIFLEIIENVEPALLNERERFWLAQIPPDKRLNGPRNR